MPLSTQILEQQEEASGKQREAELKRQAEYMATAFAEAALKERASRLGTLNEVSTHPNDMCSFYRAQERGFRTLHARRAECKVCMLSRCA